jgi:hypothetical protein
MSIIHNERVKLTANWLDRAGTAVLTLGVIAPLAAALYGYPNPPVSFGILLAGVAVCLLISAGLHFLARRVLKEVAVNRYELLAFVITPLMVLATGIAVYLVTGWQDRRDRSHTPAE